MLSRAAVARGRVLNAIEVNCHQVGTLAFGSATRDWAHSLWTGPKLVAWHSGRTLVFDRRSFTVLRSTCS